MNNWIVYKHTAPSNKVYIGITSKSVARRWRNNDEGYLRKYKSGGYIQPSFANAILKYGWDNITHEILFEGLSKEEAITKEIELISENKDNCYNLTAGGEGCHNRKVSKETKIKISKAQLGHIGYNKGIPMKEETKNKISVANSGRKLSDEHKRKISESRKGIVFSEEHKQNLSNAIKGRTAWNKGKKMPDGFGDKVSARFKGKKLSLEHIKKMNKSKQIPISIDGVKYNSYKEASLAIGVSAKTISRRINNPEFKNYIKL